jgi:IclR family acetate operon transcriptional repressor
VRDPAGATTDVRGGDRALLGSVRNAARILRAFSNADQELGVTELSRRLGLGKSTVHRLVSTLAAERLLERSPATGRYRLGLALYELGTTVTEHVDLHQAALPVLTTLRHNTGEMVHVAVLDGLEVVYVERLESHHMLPIFRRVGHRLQAHSTASGKVLLAALPPGELERRLADWRPVSKTRHTITTRAQLMTELARVAERGWAENNEEGHAGVVSVGAPIRGADGVVMAAVSVVGAATRMNGPARRRNLNLVLESAGVISRRLGWTRARSVPPGTATRAAQWMPR